ncbi:MAG: hypothetical protein ACRD19_15305 [Terriglobia bacterium]
MKGFKSLALAGVAAILFAGAAPNTQAQISVSIGVAPVCPYGYFDYAPYQCAPYGYYGPDWFNGGIFIGAGPWFHGPENFHGHVNNHFDPRHGYHGQMPSRGERASGSRRAGHVSHFKGNETRTEHGHSSGHNNGHGR